MAKVLVLISFASQDDPSMVNLAVALQNEGISTFRFDFAGNG